MARKKRRSVKRKSVKSRSRTVSRTKKFALVFGSKSKPRVGKARFSSKSSLNKRATKMFARKKGKKPIGFTRV